jgi:hypothetical protein
MRSTRLAAPLALTVLWLATGGCDGGASPTGDTSSVLPDGGIETTLPVGTDPQMTPAPNPNAGAVGAAPTSTGGTGTP